MTEIGPEPVKLQVNAELPEPVITVGLGMQDVLFVARLTSPEKPFRPVSDTVELFRDPARICTVPAGLAAIEKSTKTKVMDCVV